jgi:hypothetical protein
MLQGGLGLSSAFLNLSDSMSTDIVGRGAIHRFRFTVVDSVIRPGSALVMTFPESFDLSTLNRVAYNDSDLTNSDFLVDTFIVGGMSVLVELDTLGTTPAEGVAVVIELDSIFSPSVSGDYWVAVTAVDSAGMLLAGPSLTPALSIEPDALDSIAISPTGIQELVAGQTLGFSCRAWDRFDNELFGFQPEWSIVPLPVVLGEITEDGVYLATRTGFTKISCEVGLHADTSGVIYVFPGPFDHWHVTGFPDSVAAGVQLVDSIVVFANDLYHNTLTNFETLVWFITDDTLASVAPNSSGPFTFGESHSGREAFSGENFVFRGAGIHKIFLQDSSGYRSEVFNVRVDPGPVAGFELSYPLTAIAGETITLAMDDLSDLFGNILSEYVNVELITPGESPSGDKPEIHSFFAENGFGSAQQTLVLAGVAGFRISVGDSTVTTGNISVSNDDAFGFEFEIASPQIVGVPFSSLARLTAHDQFGNTAADFDASEDSVTLQPDAGGSVLPSSLDSDTAFVNGVCDLTRFGIKYEGQARYLTFTAISELGVSGTSNSVEINSLSMAGLSVAPEQLYRGDELTTSVTITNYGSISAQIVDLSLISTQGVVGIVSTTPPIPDLLPGNSSRAYEIKSTIPGAFNPGWTRFRCAFRGSFNDYPIWDTTDYFDSTKVLDQQSLTYYDGSLSPGIATKGEEYSFRCDVVHNGLDNISLSATSSLQFASVDADSFRAFLANPIYVPSTGQRVTLFFQSADIPPDFASGKFGVWLQLSGLQGFSEYGETVRLSDSVEIQSASDLVYATGSFSPIEVFRGTSVSPTLKIVNRGEASLQVSKLLSALRLSAGDDEIRFRLADSDTTLGHDTTLLRFDSRGVPLSFPLDYNSLTLDLQGEENGHSKASVLSLGTNVIEFRQQATVTLSSVTLIALNAPIVNMGQDFDIIAVVSNEGDEPVESIWVTMTSTGSSEFEDSLKISVLSVGESIQLAFAITASLSANPTELFTVALKSGTGSITGQDALLQPQSSLSTSVNIQTGAEVSLTSRIDSPPSAADGELDFGQEFHLIAIVSNRGQAKAGTTHVRLTLPAGGDFETGDPLEVGADVDEEIGWDITAPHAVGQYSLQVEIISPPIDSNTLLPAAVHTGSVDLPVSVVSEQSQLIVEHRFHDGDLVNRGESFTVLNLEFQAESGNVQATIRVDELRLRISDRSGLSLDASEFVISATAVRATVDFEGSIDGDEVVFDFGDDLIAGTQNGSQLAVEFTVHPDFDLPSAFVEIDSMSIKATDITFGSAGPSPEIVSPGELPVNGSKGFGVVSNEFDASFFNYPNPFAAGDEATHIVYSLHLATDVTLEIFTLTGEKVFSEVISAGSTGAQAGRNELLWTGENSRGALVRNGVYIAVLRLASGDEARIKIAVVK